MGREIGIRVGMKRELTKDEEKILFSGNGEAGGEVIKKVISAGRAMLDGETYSPQEAVEIFNEAYGTDYEEEDRRWEF